MTLVRLNLPAINRLGVGTGVRRALERLGDQIAADARTNAPKDTGAGAASIDYEVGDDDKGAYVRVSWDADHFYLLFAEVGTSTRSARPFLRPAATKRRAL